jgi:primosomal protein N'
VTLIDEDTRLEPSGRALNMARAAREKGERVVILAHRTGDALRSIASRAERVIGVTRTARLDAGSSTAELKQAIAKADLIVASPVIAKDVSPSNVGLLVIVGADAAIVQPEFRAAEEAFATWWRAGRWAARIAIETRRADHPAVVALTRWDPESLYRAESSRRRELGYPPFASLARIDVPSDRAAAVAGELGTLNGIDILGPVETESGSVVIARAKKREALLASLRPVVDAWRRRDEPMRVDVDPWEVFAPRWRS